MPEFIKKYKSKPEIARSKIMVLGASLEAQSTVGIFPLINHEQLVKAKQHVSEKGQKLVFLEAKNIGEYFSTYDQIALMERYMKMAGKEINQKAIVNPPLLNYLNMSQAFLLLATLNSQFQIKGGMHFPELKQILIQMNEDNFLLQYGEKTFIYLLNPIVLDILEGFKETIPSKDTANLVLELQKLYVQWKANAYQGDLIPSHASGFDEIEKRKVQGAARIIAQGQRDSNSFFALPPTFLLSTVAAVVDTRDLTSENVQEIACKSFGKP